MRCQLEAHWRRSELSPVRSAPHHCSPAPLSRSALPASPVILLHLLLGHNSLGMQGYPMESSTEPSAHHPPSWCIFFLGDTTLFWSPGNVIHDDKHSTEEHGRSTAKKSPSCPQSATPEQTARPSHCQPCPHPAPPASQQTHC